MIEMVIVLPLLLMLVFAIAEFGLAFARYQVLTNAAREGAREAVLYRSPCVPGTVNQDVRQVVRQQTDVLGIVLRDDEVSVSGACAPGNSVVTVASPYSLRILPNFAHELTGRITLVGRAVMRNESR